MSDLSENTSEVMEEVRALFERYAQAPVDKDVDVLDDTFRRSPHTVRLALGERGFGFDAIHPHRLACPAEPIARSDPMTRAFSQPNRSSST